MLELGNGVDVRAKIVRRTTYLYVVLSPELRVGFSVGGDPEDQRHRAVDAPSIGVLGGGGLQESKALLKSTWIASVEAVPGPDGHGKRGK